MGLEPPKAAAHRLAQPPFPRIWPMPPRATVAPRSNSGDVATAAARQQPRPAGASTVTTAFGIKIPGTCRVTPCPIFLLSLSRLRTPLAPEPPPELAVAIRTLSGRPELHHRVWTPRRRRLCPPPQAIDSGSHHRAANASSSSSVPAGSTARSRRSRPSPSPLPSPS